MNDKRTDDCVEPSCPWHGIPRCICTSRLATGGLTAEIRVEPDCPVHGSELIPRWWYDEGARLKVAAELERVAHLVRAGTYQWDSIERSIVTLNTVLVEDGSV